MSGWGLFPMVTDTTPCELEKRRSSLFGSTSWPGLNQQGKIWQLVVIVSQRL